MNPAKETISRKGFTLVESLIALAVLVIIFSVGVAVSPSFYGHELLEAERDTFVSALQRVRSKAANNIRGSAHGVYVASGNYILYEGSSFATRQMEYDEEWPKSERVDFSGAQEINFSPLEAAASSSGAVTLSYQGETFDITVKENGRISW